eukprot:scaffold260002_cov40-Prasinocladus_malaysianus.AAC.1
MAIVPYDNNNDSLFNGDNGHGIGTDDVISALLLMMKMMMMIMAIWSLCIGSVLSLRLAALSECARTFFRLWLVTQRQGNSSQLYRLLAEEIGELLAELEKQRMDRAAHETGDVLAYCLQFIWEFKLHDRFPPNPKAPARWIRMDESFAQHQQRKAQEEFR